MWNYKTIAVSGALLALGAGPGLRASAAETHEIEQLREQLRVLEQKLLILEPKQDLQAGAEPVAAKATAEISRTDKGFPLASSDDANSVRLRGLVQLDLRNYFGDEGVIDDTFVLRRARLISEGTLARNWSFQLVTEFGGSSVSVLDANLGFKVSDVLQLRFGKFKVPVGLEQLQSDTWTFFNERSIATNLASISRIQPSF